MDLHTIYFNFYGVKVKIQTNSLEIKERLQKDFSYFYFQEKIDRVFFVLEIYEEKIPRHKIPAIKSSHQSQNSITYEQNKTRYNDYYGKLLSIFDYNAEKCELYSLDKEKLHEISYLVILSRVGKKWDLQGLHKVHSMGVIYKKKAILTVMPSRGGKSTLLLDLLKNNEVEFLSDDIPLISRSGRILPMPIRIGLTNEETVFDEYLQDHIYSLEREFFGTKKLLSVEGLKNSIGHDYDHSCVIFGRRWNQPHGEMVKISKVQAFVRLFKHMVIGVGLPMIMEYFWEYGFIDFCRKTLIFFSRLIASASLVIRSETYEFFLGTDKNLNSTGLLNFFEKRNVDKWSKDLGKNMT